ncbi:GCD14-domain-containing protein [Teratosphaeria nubilosa]|uniref:tRNA (adenine(58)-N(1))-methyltransferase catalytic subunit TRM61 n=1 Tax=Teratosphaeria nubilosa TaxID=161662 RepID=A0A6G1LBL2_9PEZI|nr:GCD14-domain-containing protein [Teratosphaeria nubilosa]
MASEPKASAFFNTPSRAVADTLAILHLKRDASLPVRLQETADDGYAEGAVTNTRFGSFPHSTLIGLDWGSQVRASKVDTGTRGRTGKRAKQQQDSVVTEATVVEEGDANRKRKDASEPELDIPVKKLKQHHKIGSATVDTATTLTAEPARVPIEAGSGFIHILQPTPESWTSSLDHRTQVVYTPDYSYVLQRLRVKPGSTIIEAGAGSGSFTHAAARAIYSGRKQAKPGKVCSYEFHAPRVETLRQEISDHGLEDVVQLTHRDVCNDGFLLPDGTSPKTNAIFLDLPAPWQALRHLTRSGPSALDPETDVHVCTFSPCIEQVTSTVSHLRKAGWSHIQMVEIQNHRIDVRREQVGLRNEGLRGVNASAATVEESIQRLKEVDQKLEEFHALKNSMVNGSGNGAEFDGKNPRKSQSKAKRLEKIRKEAEERKTYKEGNLVHRTEPEVKTHTSYLVFAILPREWSEEDEAKAADAWPVDQIMLGAEGKKEEVSKLT